MGAKATKRSGWRPGLDGGCERVEGDGDVSQASGLSTWEDGIASFHGTDLGSGEMIKSSVRIC